MARDRSKHLGLALGNTIFEPLWNRNYIDNVQITVAEEVIIGRRADYYDRSGVLRDMFQNHLFQLMMVTAMEGPVKFTADQVRDEKVKVLRAVRPLRAPSFRIAECVAIRGLLAGSRSGGGQPYGDLCGPANVHR